MAVISTDIKFYLSGDSGNTDENASLGGGISGTEITTATLNNLFDDVSGAEAGTGIIDYRCLYVMNTNGVDSLTAVLLWIQANTSSTDTTIAIGLDPAGINGTATTIASEDDAPAGVTFDHSPEPVDAGSALSIGNLTAGDYQAIWVRRTVDPGAAPTGNDNATLRVQGTP